MSPRSSRRGCRLSATRLVVSSELLEIGLTITGFAMVARGLARAFGHLHAGVDAIALWMHEFAEAVDKYRLSGWPSGPNSPHRTGWVPLEERHVTPAGGRQSTRAAQAPDGTGRRPQGPVSVLSVPASIATLKDRS